MYAIVDVKDKQFKVQEDDTLYVPYHSDADVDEELTLDRVLLVSDATVSARVVDHVKGDKVIVFKKKRRKRYRVKRGHRQQYTQIHIDALDVNGASSTSDEAAADEADAEADPADAEPDTAEADE
jgi:large subunit ribosomal protein L21